MNAANFLELFIPGGMPKQKKSYESDLSQLPEKHQPKYNMQGVALPGVASGFAADWPGMKLRTGPDGQFKYDFYNPLKEDARPNEFGSPEEELDYKRAQGLGEMGAAATLLPGVVKQGGRMVLGALAGRELGAATKESANAARWMSPVVDAIPGNPAMLGEEAAQAANKAGKRVIGAKEAVVGAKQFGKGLDPAIKGGNRLIGATMVGNATDKLLGAARNSVSSEDVEQPVVVPDMEMGDVTDMSGLVQDNTQPQPAPANRLLDVMAGRKQIEPYQRKDSLLEKIAYAIFPEEGRRNKRADERAYLESQIMQQGFVDPETQFKLQELGADNQAGRASGLQQQQGNIQLRNSVAPTMSAQTLEQQLGLGSGAISPELLARMTRQKDDSGLLELLLSGGLGGGQGLGIPAPVQAAQPVVNIPRR